ncbi:hypothetical protein [Turneriella parva]|uniref:Uncharacterized protein n=1 Tax=Turneriella parva (strain ATCC BAA-1111 / DSM 21527 / NCTC 11395 / H) TaxID=869212 RepID=I4B2S4_TURPD|nr:hypothetical protein [Turneriella parva]AFM11581.1 hypothetical protein Turpa_0932 [Turneriella parva DSM 21527]
MRTLATHCLLLFVLTRCQNTSTDELLAATSIKGPLRLSPVNATVVESQTLQFSVTGGNPP